MGRLIDADALVARLEDYAKHMEDPLAIMFTYGAINDIKREPTVVAPQWVPCSERLPENRVSVIVCYREWQPYAKRYLYAIVIGWYARKNSVNENVFCEWDADCDYDEDDDEYYIKEGWYEFTTQGNSDRMNWFINAEVVAWMPLPETFNG